LKRARSLRRRGLHADQHGGRQDRHHCPEADQHRDLDDVDQQHLAADEDQDDGQAVAQQVELAGHGGEQEVHGAQAEDGEHIARQHDEGIGRDGEDGRDRVDREDHVGHADQADHQQQRRGDAPTVLDGEELLAVEALADRHQPAQELERRVALQVGLLAGGPPHLDAGEQQEGAEQVEDPVELLQQPAAGQDHDRAQHDGADDADHQHPLLVGRRHREVGEDHQEDKDVVDRQALLDQVAGQEFERLGVGPVRCRRCCP
jgi:hypothetical protein